MCECDVGDGNNLHDLCTIHVHSQRQYEQFKENCKHGIERALPAVSARVSTLKCERQLLIFLNLISNQQSICSGKVFLYITDEYNVYTYAYYASTYINTQVSTYVIELSIAFCWLTTHNKTMYGWLR